MADLSRIRQPIYMMGWPSAIGGANSERWHTLKLWREAGLDVTVMASGVPMPDHADWLERLERIGCRTGIFDWSDDPRIVVGFCDSGFRRRSPDLRNQGNRTIYVPCMLAPYHEEKYGQPIADRYVFQSHYQRDKLLPALGLPDGTYRVIRGAFDATKFKFNPLSHKPGEPFIVGKLASHGYMVAVNSDGTHTMIPRLEKWPADLWAQYERIPYRPLKARVMGWHEAVEAKCGAPPEWAEVLPQGAETAQKFLESIHCLVPGIGCCAENWPRIGLEAGAVGTAILAEYKGGWIEMLRPWQLAATVEEQAVRVAQLAHNEIVTVARNYDQSDIVQQWLSLFAELSA